MPLRLLGRRFAFGGMMSDPSLLSDIEALQTDEVIIGSIERDDGVVVVVTLQAFDTEDDARAFMDELEAAEDLAAMGPQLH